MEIANLCNAHDVLDIPIATTRTFGLSARTGGAMKISQVLGMAAIAVLTATSTAMAAPSPTALTIKVGGSIQTNADAGTSGLAAGVDYTFHPSSTLEPINGSIYADLLGRTIGAGVAIRNGGPLYLGAGVGLYNVSASDGQNAAGVGGKVFGGFSVAPLTTLELGYHFLPQVHGINTNTVTLQVGLHL